MGIVKQDRSADQKSNKKWLAKSCGIFEADIQNAVIGDESNRGLQGSLKSDHPAL